MNNIQRCGNFNYTAEQMFALVNDINSYSEFLSWCKNSYVVEQNDIQVLGVLELSKGPFNYILKTKNTVVLNEQIKLTLIEGPFSVFDGSWEFKNIDNNQSEVFFCLDFKFNSKILAMTLNPIFNTIADTMLDSFRNRAKQVYDKN